MLFLFLRASDETRPVGDDGGAQDLHGEAGRVTERPILHWICLTGIAKCIVRMERVSHIPKPQAKTNCRPNKIGEAVGCC